MRSFDFLFIALFLLFFLLLSLASVKNLVKTFYDWKIKYLQWVFWGVHSIILFGFIYLYIYPNQPIHATNYPLYFYFNVALFTFIVFDSPLAISYILHTIFEKKTIIIPYCGFIIALGLFTVMIFGIIHGTQKVTIKRVVLEYSNLPPDFDNYQLIHISDLHAGSMLKPAKLLKRTQEIIESFNPNLILFTGDLVNNFANEMDGLKSELKEMTEGIPAYSILGNHDYGDYTIWDDHEKKRTNFESILSLHAETGFTLLNNENAIIRQGNDSIFIAGVENWGHPPFPQYANLKEALTGIPSKSFTLLMTHDPAHWETQIEDKKNIELTLSGHTHGLQWGIKPAGIPFSLACLARKNWGGLYFSGSSVLNVSTGLGIVGVPWRLDMSPEVTIIKLKRGEIN